MNHDDSGTTCFQWKSLREGLTGALKMVFRRYIGFYFPGVQTLTVTSDGECRRRLPQIREECSGSTYLISCLYAEIYIQRVLFSGSGVVTPFCLVWLRNIIRGFSEYS